MPTYITTQARTIANRALKAGQEFRASRRDGEILIKRGLAVAVPAALAQSSFKIPPPPAPPKAAKSVEPEPAGEVTTPESEASAPEVVAPLADPLATARDDYERIVGKRWFHGWNETELRRRIAEFEAGNIGS